MKKVLPMLAILFVSIILVNSSFFDKNDLHGPSTRTQSKNVSDDVIANAFSNHLSNVQVSGEGNVIKILPDDNKGSRHQRFIIRLSSGQTLLIAHNIDLAPRVSSLKVGSHIKFFGEYEWNNKGGVIHWTHNDPNGFHVNGWLEYKGKKYQ